MAEVEIAMPKLSDSMEEATVLVWLKRPGDTVRRGEPLVEVETDKATVVYEAEANGVLGEIIVDDGGTALLGAVIARLTTDGPPESAAERLDERAPAAPATGRPRATPIAHKLANQLGVSLADVDGTGPGGRIVRADVREAVAQDGATRHPTDGRGELTVLTHTATQRTIAQRMSESRSTIPEFTLEAEIAMEAAARLREDLRVGGVDPLPSYNDLIIRAVALALRDMPMLNASYVDDSTHRFGRINVGIAVATDDALVVPTLYDADRKSVAEIATESRRLADRARSRALSTEELANGTFTVSNLGMFGIRRFNAVINHPQAAILAVGEVAERPVAENGRLRATTTMEVSLSCDHRVVYGADGARFVQRLRSLLEHPALLLTDAGRP
jgi:pyruvate dehydrogenase E2 component (dihydrolipoamide acetyltransferase)